MCAGQFWQLRSLLLAGLPLSAVLQRRNYGKVTAGNSSVERIVEIPLACAASLKTIEIMEREKLADRACEIGKKVMETYESWKEKYPVIGDVRGMGAMIGLELVKDAESKEPAAELTSKVIQSAAQKGLIIENAGIYGNVLRFLAPLVITDEQLQAGLDILEEAIKENM